MTYSSVFGTGTISSSNVSYLALTLAGNVTLSWPKETAPSPNLLATLIDITSAAAPHNVTLPDATQGSNGAEFLFNNLSASVITVLDSSGGVVLTLPVGQAWLVYLASNSTAAGTWRSFQLGSFTSQAQAASLAGPGLIAIGNTLAGDLPSLSFNNVGHVFVLTDRAKAYRWTGGAGNCTLPATGTVPQGWFMRLRNDGTGSLTVNPGGGDTINGAASLTLGQNDSCLILMADAGVVDTYGLGQSTSFGFDYTTIAVPGTGAYTLSGAELNRISYKFTGILTGDRTIIVPATVQQYWITNSTTGAHNFYVKTAAQAAPGVQVATNQASILYSDSNNVVPADTASGGVSVPVTIAQGGTNATTAGAARTNLGSTAVGDALFIAASAATARATLGSTAVGDALFTAATAAAARGTLGSTAVGDAVFIAANAGAALTALTAPGLALGNTFTAAQTITLTTAATNLSLVSTDAGAAEGPILALNRSSASPAVSDVIGGVQLGGNSSTGVARVYADWLASLLDPTNTSEDAQAQLRAMIAGTLTSIITYGPGVQVGAPAGGDKGAGTLNATTLYEAGTSLAAKYAAIGSGGLSAASQAQMEAATVNTVAATPGTTQFHPGVAKFWVKYISSTGVVQASYNVTSVTHNGAGNNTVTIGTNFSSANWCCLATYTDSGGSPATAGVDSQAAGTVNIITRFSGGGSGDSGSVFVAGFGDQ